MSCTIFVTLVWTAFFQANYDALTYHVILTDTGGYYLISSEEYPVSEYTSTGDGGLDLLTDQSDLPGHFFFVPFLQDYDVDEGFSNSLDADFIWGIQQVS